ncbi:MAG: UPF0158 family protein [Parachlamydiales bacterium]|nr:UPF0158 family protein [Parachlamydiales bacterium]
MAEKSKSPQKSSLVSPQCPLILRSHRLMDAFAKSDDERDFYLDRMEGFIVFVDLNKTQPELDELEKELNSNRDRYCMIPKLTFYETKKIMEGFVNEKVYDIDTKEKLLDIIQQKEARDNFLEFIYDHHSELEKWQQFYQERSRIRIIEWLRNNNYQFVFEEDLDLPKATIEKLKTHLFEVKAPKEVSAAREALFSKAKTYYSTEALNPRPKRGRPPKQTAKVEIEPQMTIDIYTSVPPIIRPFLYIPDIMSASAVTFSSKFENEEAFLANMRQGTKTEAAAKWDSLSQKLASIRNLSRPTAAEPATALPKIDWSMDDDDDEDDEEGGSKKKAAKKAPATAKPKAEAKKSKATHAKKPVKKKTP